ncbi:hypothetical protein D3C87_1599660 [compost metagenome]
MTSSMPIVATTPYGLVTEMIALLAARVTTTCKAATGTTLTFSTLAMVTILFTKIEALILSASAKALTLRMSRFHVLPEVMAIATT